MSTYPVVRVWSLRLADIWMAECHRCPWWTNRRDHATVLAAADHHARTHTPRGDRE